MSTGSQGPAECPKECQVKGCYPCFCFTVVTVVTASCLSRLSHHACNGESLDTTFRFAQPTSKITWEPSGSTQMAGIASNEKHKVFFVKFISSIGHRISIALQALSVSPLASTKVDLRMDS